jgi:hypothetical protein
MPRGKSIDAVTAAKNGRRGKSAWEARKAAGANVGIDVNNLTKPLADKLVIPRIWGQGGRPFFRKDSLRPWPELERALLGETHD